MKKYKVLITGNIWITTDSEDKAIEIAQNRIDDLHKSLNMSIFAISELEEE